VQEFSWLDDIGDKDDPGGGTDASYDGEGEGGQRSLFFLPFVVNNPWLPMAGMRGLFLLISVQTHTLSKA
jgi:hypothetical protein